jgi:hypothetical protein
MNNWLRAAFAITKFVAGILGFVVILVTILYVFLYQGEQQFSEFRSLQSPDKHHILTVNISNPSTPYGPHGIEVVLTKSADRKVETSKQFHLSNDGANIQSHNIEIRWRDNDNGSICLKGAEQVPMQISVQVHERKIESRTESC